MAQPSPPVETITGTVEQTNERGVRVAGTWYNVSAYRPVALPLRGQPVAITVKGKWIERVDVLDAQDAHSEPQRAAQPSSARERTITRLAVLKAAAAFAASRPEAKSTDVLPIADRWLAWVEGEAEA